MKYFSGKTNAKHEDVHSKRFILPIALVLTCLFALAMATGCTSQSSPSTDAEQEQASEEVATQQDDSADDSNGSADTQDATEAEAEAETSTDAENASWGVIPTEEEVELNNKWADTTVRNALDELVNEGAIAPIPSDAELMGDAFQYESADPGYGIAFEDEAIGAELSADYILPSGKVIIGRIDYGNEFRPVKADYADGDWVYEAVGERVPLFYPESLDGHFSAERTETILENVPVETFANSTDECDYLIIFDSVASHVDEDYYMGSIDRTSVTSLVFVIDVNEGKIVHIENVGTDTPGSTVEMGQQRGDLLWDEVAAYLNELLLNRSES